MKLMEKVALEHAKEWLVYAQSKQSVIDLEKDKIRREKLDQKFGHSPKCGILNCHPSCLKKSKS